MENNSTLYIVSSRDHTSLDEIYAIFDCQKKSTKFINRFKTRQESLQITTHILNPTFYIDKNTDPYYLAFDKTDIIPKDVFICNSIMMDDDARLESFNISFSLENEVDNGIFIYQCFAANEQEAIRKAISKRERLIVNGDWDRAWAAFNLKRLLSKKSIFLESKADEFG